MADVIGVRFREEGKTYYFNPRGEQIKAGTDVIVETSRGVEYGVCVSPNETIDDSMIIQPLRNLIRTANDEDRKRWQENRQKEAEAFAVCEQKIAEHQLDMKLVEVEYTLDCSKILFFFTSEGRVDFRELVKELASLFRTRIELRQIGVRDEAKMLGGLGICGRPFCCSTFMDEFQPVSIKMAKTQNLSLNPTKISGTCGRLMCCLKYEQDTYEYLIANSVKADSYVKTAYGKGTVVDVNLFKGTVKVKLEGDNDDGEIKTLKSSQVFVLRSGKKGPMVDEPEDLVFETDEPGLKAEADIPDPFEAWMNELQPREEEEEAPAPKKQSHGRRRRKQSQEDRPQKPQEQGKGQAAPEKENRGTDRSQKKGSSHRQNRADAPGREEQAPSRGKNSQKKQGKKPSGHSPDKVQAREQEQARDSQQEKRSGHRNRPRHRPKAGPRPEHTPGQNDRAGA